MANYLIRTVHTVLNLTVNLYRNMNGLENYIYNSLFLETELVVRYILRLTNNTIWELETDSIVDSSTFLRSLPRWSSQAKQGVVPWQKKSRWTLPVFKNRLSRVKCLTKNVCYKCHGYVMVLVHRVSVTPRAKVSQVAKSCRNFLPICIVLNLSSLQETTNFLTFPAKALCQDFAS